jgi:hypothetical protein
MAQWFCLIILIYGTTLQPVIKVEFTEPVKPSSVALQQIRIEGRNITTTLQN